MYRSVPAEAPASSLGRGSLESIVSSALSQKVLLLNRFFQPVHITTARRAICLLYLGAARAMGGSYQLFSFEDWRRATPELPGPRLGLVTGQLAVPRVLVVHTYGGQPMAKVRFSRKNVFLRDDHTCQYCGQRALKQELNLDHVFPRSRGGRTTWENLVTSCIGCNVRKGGRTPSEANMQLRRPPKRPGIGELFRWVHRERYQEWMPFLRELRAG